MSRLATSLFAAAVLTVGAAPAWGQFQYITPAGQVNQAIGISNNGEYVVGGGGTNGFLWSEGGGLVTGFGAPIQAWDVTDDGAFLVGSGINGASQDEAASWSAGAGFSFYGNAGGVAGCGFDLSHLNGVSADASTAVGMSWQGCRTSPLRWTDGTGLTLLVKQNVDSSARCYAVSDDGVVAVGWDQGLATGQGFSRRASVWTDDATQVFICTTPGNPNGLGEATNTNSDGSVICGITQGSAYRWTAGGGLDVLPDVPGINGTYTANDISEDGEVAVGVVLSGFPATATAIIWRDDIGAMRLADYLTSLGVTGFGNDLLNATGISADGKRICGWGGSRAWVVDLPEPVWADIGGELDGAYGKPELTGVGTLQAGTLVRVILNNALENATVGLVVGLSQLNAPFKGGVMVPNPDVIITPLTTNATGSLLVSSLWPAGVPSGFVTTFQEWIVDAAGPKGFAASNALTGTAP